MSLTNGGRDYIAAAIVGLTVSTADQVLTIFDNAHAALSVGDSATAFAVAQTDLQAATNKLRKGMQATFPTRAANVLTFKAQFGSAEANWAWNEVGVHNSVTAATGTMLSRNVASLGTKAAGSTWDLTHTVTLAV